MARGAGTTTAALLVFYTLLLGAAATCSASDNVPRGYYAQLEIAHNGRSLMFGPFVGYYFRPVSGADTSHLEFVCYNTGQYYTDDLGSGVLLFRGEAQLATLPEVSPIPDAGQRITPVFAAKAPSAWLNTRPQPQDEFRHFHSAYNHGGATYTGYWLRHEATEKFTYNMGGRLHRDSPLYHEVKPGNPADFPAIVEFDKGK